SVGARQRLEAMDPTATETDPSGLGDFSGLAPHPCDAFPPGGHRSEARRRSTRSRSRCQFGCVHRRCARQATGCGSGVGSVPVSLVRCKLSTRRQETEVHAWGQLTSFDIGARVHLNISKRYNHDFDQLLVDSALAAIDPEAPWTQIEQALQSLTAALAK